MRPIILAVLFASLASAALGQSGNKVAEIASAGCGGTTLCIDDQPGDRRFQVSVDLVTSQGGGAEGPGQSIALSGLGVTNGGMFWFFSANNPELLVRFSPDAH